MPLILYFPSLLPRTDSGNLPYEILFFNPGTGDAQNPRLFTPANLPLSGPEARAALRELLDMGEILGKDGALRTRSGQSSPWRNPAGRDESAALAAFARNGSITERTTDEPRDERAILLAAQKTLLLALSLEESLGEIAAFERNCADKSLLLRQALGDGENEQEAEEPAGRNFGLPWQTVLRAMSFFIPPETLLYTREPEAGELLAEQGCFKEPPEALQSFCAEHKLRFASAPLWQMLGLSRPSGALFDRGFEILTF